MKESLSDRCLRIAIKIRSFIKTVPHSITNFEYCKQLARSSASIGANYIEASNGLGNRDYIMRLRIARKEGLESVYWLKLIESTDKEQVNILIDEIEQLSKIFSSIIRKFSKQTNS